MIYEINEIVSKVGQVVIEGNIIPDQWYVHLRNRKGKIQTNAALILADILHWYRPIPIYTISTGDFKGYGKRFKEDLLQQGYKYFSQKFGFTSCQTRDALIFLENKGLIFREFRDLVIGNQALNSVMYIRIYPEKILEITGRSKALQPNQHPSSPDSVLAEAAEEKKGSSRKAQTHASRERRKSCKWFLSSWCDRAKIRRFGLDGNLGNAQPSYAIQNRGGCAKVCFCITIDEYFERR